MSTITNEQAQEITGIINTRAPHVAYEVFVPNHAQALMNEALKQYWQVVLDCHPNRIDWEYEQVQETLNEESVLEFLVESNENTEFESTWIDYLSNNGTFTFGDLQDAYARTIVDDVTSAWVQTIRDAVEEVCGFDPANEDINWGT